MYRKYRIIYDRNWSLSIKKKINSIRNRYIEISHKSIQQHSIWNDLIKYSGWVQFGRKCDCVSTGYKASFWLSLFLCIQNVEHLRKFIHFQQHKCTPCHSTMAMVDRVNSINNQHELASIHNMQAGNIGETVFKLIYTFKHCRETEQS